MEDMVMMMISSPESPPSHENVSQEQITNSTCPSWKLYENPFYYSHHNHQQQQQCQTRKHLHHLHLPLSARKIAASFWDLTFIKPVMESELEVARAQIIDLKAELEYERKARKKAESVNKRLVKELAEERRGREALERVCEDLAAEITLDKVEIDRMKKEIEEERKMLRMAEILREERVQMKLADAKMLFEEKLIELEETKRTQQPDGVSSSKMEQRNQENKTPRLGAVSNTAANLSGKFSRMFLGVDDHSSVGDSRESAAEKLSSSWNDINSNSTVSSSMAIQRKGFAEAENPHIKRGIKGFVEFPRVVRAMGSKSRHWGTKLECQKAQLKILLKQRSPIRSNNLIIS